MTAERIVLGWAARGVTCPAGVTRASVGLLDLLMHAADSTPKDRLAAQSLCFSHGLGFVPAAPASTLSETVGRSLGLQYQDRLLADLDALDGAGQLYLILHYPAPPEARMSGHTGRAWLQARSYSHNRAMGAALRAENVLQQLIQTQVAAQIQRSGERLSTALLVQRSQMHALCDSLRGIASSIDMTGLAVSLSGLWPPFHFVKPFPDMTGPCL